MGIWRHVRVVPPASVVVPVAWFVPGAQRPGGGAVAKHGVHACTKLWPVAPATVTVGGSNLATNPAGIGTTT
jgi:hypothetical protein